MKKEAFFTEYLLHWPKGLLQWIRTSPPPLTVVHYLVMQPSPSKDQYLSTLFYLEFK